MSFIRNLLFLILITFSSAIFAQDIVISGNPNFWNYGIYPGQYYYPVPYTYQIQPQRIVVPQTIYKQYQYRGSSIIGNTYPTPVRDALFGRWRYNHYYSPINNDK